MKKLLREKKLREKAKVSVPIIERSEDLACFVSRLVFNSGKGCQAGPLSVIVSTHFGTEVIKEDEDFAAIECS